MRLCWGPQQQDQGLDPSNGREGAGGRDLYFLCFLDEKLTMGGKRGRQESDC